MLKNTNNVLDIKVNCITIQHKGCGGLKVKNCCHKISTLYMNIIWKKTVSRSCLVTPQRPLENQNRIPNSKQWDKDDVILLFAEKEVKAHFHRNAVQ
jgi:hypothetical protein